MKGRTINLEAALNPPSGKVHDTQWSLNKRPFAQGTDATLAPGDLPKEKGKPAPGSYLIAFEAMNEQNQEIKCTAEFDLKAPYWTKGKKIGVGLAGAGIAAVIICAAMGCFSGGPGLTKTPVPRPR